MERLLHGLPVHDARRQTLNGTGRFVEDGSFTINGLCKSIDNTTHKSLAHGHLHNASRAPDLIALANFCVFAEQHDADLRFFQVQRQTHDAMGKLEELAGHDLLETVDASDTITNGNHAASLADINARLVLFDLFSNNPADFVCFDLHDRSLISPQ